MSKDSIGTDILLLVGAEADTQSLEETKRRLAEFKKEIGFILSQDSKAANVFAELEKKAAEFSAKGVAATKEVKDSFLSLSDALQKALPTSFIDSFNEKLKTTVATLETIKKSSEAIAPSTGSYTANAGSNSSAKYSPTATKSYANVDEILKSYGFKALGDMGADTKNVIKDAAKHFFGNYIGKESTQSELNLAFANFIKFAKSAETFSAVVMGGTRSWAGKASLASIMDGLEKKSIAFDNAVGFRFKDLEGAKALGLNRNQTSLIMGNQQNLPLTALQNRDLLSGTNSAMKAYETLLSNRLAFSDSDKNSIAARLNEVLRRLEAPTMVAKQAVLPSYNASAITNAYMNGGLSLPSKGGIKVNNEDGLRALQITEKMAIAQGLLSKEYGGLAYKLQQASVKYNTLNADERAAIEALNIEKNNVEHLVAAYKALSAAQKNVAASQITGKSVDLTAETKRVFDQNALSNSGLQGKITAKSQQLYAGLTAASKAAADDLSIAHGNNARTINTLIKRLQALDTEIEINRVAMNNSGKDGDAWAASLNRVTLAIERGSAAAKIANSLKGTEKTSISDVSKELEKYANRAGYVKKAVEDLANAHGVGTKQYNDQIKMMNSHEKRMDSTVFKMQELNRMGQKWDISAFKNNVNMVQDMNGAIGSSTNKTMREVDAAFKKAANSGSILKLVLGDLFEKFKILAGYAISGAAVYGVGNALKEALVTTIQYDQALHDLKAITMSTTQEADDMGKEILRVATTSKFSILELTGGMKTLGQAGLSAQESIAALEPIVQLATATLSDFKTTADLVTSTMGSFAIQTGEEAKIADIFSAAMNRSKLDIDKLRVAFNYVGPVAHDAGISLEDTAAAMSLLSNSGLRASTIGTSMKQVLDSLLNPSEKFRKAILMAGYAVEDVNPRTNEFSKIVGRLQEIVPTATEALEYFGQRGSSSVSALTTAGEEGFARMAKMMSEHGTTAKMAAEQAEGLANKYRNIATTAGVLSEKTAQALSIDTVFRVFADSVRGVLDLFLRFGETNAGNFVAVFAKISVAIITVVGAFAALKTAILWFTAASTAEIPAAVRPLILLFKSLGVSVASVGLAVQGLFTKMMLFLGITSPWVGVGVIIAGVAAATYGVIKATELFTDRSKLQAEAIHNASLAAEADVKAAEKQKKSYEDLVVAITDEGRSLTERKSAISSLITLGADFDYAVFSNVNSVEDFNSALRSALPTIQKYGSVLDANISKMRAHRAEAHLTEMENAEKEASKAQKNLSEVLENKPVAFGVTYKRDEAAQAKAVNEADAKVQETLSEQERTSKLMLTDIVAAAKSNKELMDKVGELNRSGKYDELEKYLQNDGMNKILDGLGIKDNQGLSAKFSKAIIESLTDTKLAAEETRKRLEKVDPLTGLEKYDKAKLGETLRSIGSSLKTAQQEAEKSGKEIIANLERTLSGTALEDAKKEQEEKTKNKIANAVIGVAKEVETGYKQYEEMVQAEVAALEAEKRVFIAELNKDTAANPEKEKENNELIGKARLEIAQKKLEGVKELRKVYEESGAIGQEIREKLKVEENNAMAELTDSQTALIKKNTAFDKRGAAADRRAENAARADDLEEARNLARKYKADLSSIREEQSAELEQLDIDYIVDTDEKQQKAYDIKIKYAEMAYAKAVQYEKDQQALVNNGHSIGNIEEVGRKEISTQRRIRDQQIADLKEFLAKKKQLELDALTELADEKESITYSFMREDFERERKEQELQNKISRRENERRLQDGIDSKAVFNAKEENRKLQNSERLNEIDREQKENELEVTSGFLGQLSSMFGEYYSQSGEQAKAFFYLQKAFAVAQIIMDTHVAAAKASSASFFGIGGLTEAAAVMAMGYASAGMVAGMTISQSFADGGKVRGYSPSSRADNILARVTANEFIHPVDTVKYYGDGVMEAMRLKKIPKEILTGFSANSPSKGYGSFSGGGSVAGGGVTNNGAPVNITINGGDEESVKKALPELIKAVKKAVGDDIKNDGQLRKTIIAYGR